MIWQVVKNVGTMQQEKHLVVAIKLKFIIALWRAEIAHLKSKLAETAPNTLVYAQNVIGGQYTEFVIYV